jgi:hypothetical protein
LSSENEFIAAFMNGRGHADRRFSLTESRFMKLTPLVFLPALLPAFALAGTVFFTDSQHLPTNLPPDVPVVLLMVLTGCRPTCSGNCLQTRSRPRSTGQADYDVSCLATKTAATKRFLSAGGPGLELGIKKVPLWYLMTAMWCTAPRMWPWPLPCVTGEVVSEYKTFPHQNHGVLAGGCHGTGYGNRAGSCCST